MQFIEYNQGLEIVEPMIVANMPNEVYHATEHMSKSKLDLFNRSPAHLYCAEPVQPTRAMDLGTAIHTAVLEPERFDTDYMLLRDCKDRRQAQYKDAVKHYGATNVLVASEIKNVTGMAETARANPDYVSGYSSVPHNVELSFFGVCSLTGKKIKCRFDLLTTDGRALDLKKVQDIRDAEWGRSIMNYRYHVQHAFYSHVYKCVTGHELQSFEFFIVEENPPHANMIARLCTETQQVGRTEMLEDLQGVADTVSKTDGIWQPASVTSLPAWYLNQFAADAFFSEE